MADPEKRTDALQEIDDRNILKFSQGEREIGNANVCLSKESNSSSTITDDQDVSRFNRCKEDN